MGIGVFKTPTLGGRRFHWIGDWCVQHTNPWWQEVPLNWGLVCSTHRPLVAGGSTGFFFPTSMLTDLKVIAPLHI